MAGVSSEPSVKAKPGWRAVAIGVLVFLSLAALLTYGALFLNGLRTYRITSSSMDKTVREGDTMLADLNAYKHHAPVRGDVVVFRHNDTVLIKRLIGIAGDRIEGRDGVIFVNGKALDEPYAEHIGENMGTPDTFEPKLVAPGMVFLLGDNRNYSLDSRLAEFGDVKQADIAGKATYIVSSKTGQSMSPIH